MLFYFIMTCLVIFAFIVYEYGRIIAAEEFGRRIAKIQIGCGKEIYVWKRKDVPVVLNSIPIYFRILFSGNKYFEKRKFKNFIIDMAGSALNLLTAIALCVSLTFVCDYINNKSVENNEFSFTNANIWKDGYIFAGNVIVKQVDFYFPAINQEAVPKTPELNPTQNGQTDEDYFFEYFLYLSAVVNIHFAIISFVFSCAIYIFQLLKKEKQESVYTYFF